MTGRDFISASLRLIGAIAPGESLPAQEATDGLASVNRMLASWSTEGLMIYSKVREVFSLVPGQQAYTMGVGGNFNTSRPMQIEEALLRYTGTSPASEIPVSVLTLDQWAAIVVKDVQSTLPTYIYPEGTNPLETVNVWPVPTAAYSLVLYSWKALSQFPDLTTDVQFPPGYEEALVFNAAIRFAPEYGKQTPPEVAQIAMDSKANLKRINFRPKFLKVDAGLLGTPKSFNWITGESR